MKVWSLYLVLLLVVCALTSAQADTHMYSLTGGWLGVYYAYEYWDGNLDLGTQFSSIQSVSMSWTGEVTSGYDDFLLPVRAYFRATLEDGQGGVLATATSPWSSQNYSFPTVNFNTQSAFSAGSWDFLLDGQVYMRISCRPENNDFVDYPSGDIESASLVVTGTPVPEPTSLFSVALGLSGFVAAARRRRS